VGLVEENTAEHPVRMKLKSTLNTSFFTESLPLSLNFVGQKPQQKLQLHGNVIKPRMKNTLHYKTHKKYIKTETKPANL
jgi:hypothetical protein